MIWNRHASIECVLIPQKTIENADDAYQIISPIFSGLAGPIPSAKLSLYSSVNKLQMTMTTKTQPTTITEKLAVTMQTALLAPAKKYDMHHNIRIQVTTKHNYKEHIPGKHYIQQANRSIDRSLSSVSQ